MCCKHAASRQVAGGTQMFFKLHAQEMLNQGGPTTNLGGLLQRICEHRDFLEAWVHEHLPMLALVKNSWMFSAYLTLFCVLLTDFVFLLTMTCNIPQ